MYLLFDDCVLCIVWDIFRCGHYFCSKCAIKKYKESDGCAVCGEKTNGSFSTATKLIKKLKKMRKI